MSKGVQVDRQRNHFMPHDSFSLWDICEVKEISRAKKNAAGLGLFYPGRSFFTAGFFPAAASKSRPCFRSRVCTMLSDNIEIETLLNIELGNDDNDWMDTLFDPIFPEADLSMIRYLCDGSDNDESSVTSTHGSNH